MSGPELYGQTISVVVPVYNRAHLLAKALGCITAQSYPHLEIIVADDCSTDDSAAVVRDLAQADPRIKLVQRAQNGGAAAARNTGVLAATGALIAFHDSDDVCTLDKLEAQLRLLDSLPPEYSGVHAPRIIHSVLETGDYGKMQIGIFPPPGDAPLQGDMLARTRHGNSMHLTTMLLRRAAVEACYIGTGGPFDEKLRNNEDWDFTLRLAVTGPFGFLPDPCYLTSKAEAGKSGNISKNAGYSAQSYVRISGKLRRDGQSGPWMARHYERAARFLLRTGRPKAARRFARRALKLNARLWRCWGFAALSYAPSLYRNSRS